MNTTNYITVATPMGDAEVEITQEGTHFNSIILLPTGAEMEVHTETEDQESALDIVINAVEFWSENAHDEVPDLNEIDCPF